MARRLGPFWRVTLGLLYIVAGLASYYVTFLRPTWEIIDARSWQVTACVVTESRIESRESSEGTDYRLEIRYSYSA